MSSNVIDQLLQLLMLWSLAATVALLVIALLRTVLHRMAGAGAALRLWWILPLALLITTAPKEVRVAVPVHSESFQILDPGVPAANSNASPTIRIEAATEASPASPTRPGITPAIMMWAWLLGALGVAIWLVVAQWRYQRLIVWRGRRGVLPNEHVPAVIGLWSPRLVLPEDFMHRYSAEERHLIRLHEAVHQVRRDGLSNLCMSLLRVLLWFHPLVHWAAGALRDDQEAACDEVVVKRHPGQVRVYAQALLRSAEASLLPRAPLVNHWLAFHPVVRRVAMLRRYREQPSKRIFAMLALGLGGLSSATVVYALQPTTIVNVAVADPAQPVPMIESSPQHQANSSVQPNLSGAIPTESLNAPQLKLPGLMARMNAREPEAQRELASLPSLTALPSAPALAQNAERAAGPASAAAQAGSPAMLYLAVEVRRNDRLIASPAMVVKNGHPASLRIDGGEDDPVSFTATPSSEADGKIAINIELPSNETFSTHADSIRMKLSPRKAGKDDSDPKSQRITLLTYPGEKGVVKVGSGPDATEWSLRVFPVPRFAAANGGTGTEVSAMTAFACAGTGQSLLPRMMRLLSEDAQVTSIYRDADSELLKLVGVARGTKRLPELLKGLGTDPSFRNVNLLSAIRNESGDTQFQIELALVCDVGTQVSSKAAPGMAAAKTRAENIGLNFDGVKFSTLITVLGDAMGRKLRGTEALPTDSIRLNIMPVDVAQSAQALLACAGFRMVEDAGQWWVRRDAARKPEANLNECAARDVVQAMPANKPAARTWPASFQAPFRVVLRVDMGSGLYSNYEKSVSLGEVMRLPIANDAALACSLMSIADKLHLRCTENQDGLPLPAKHVVMKRIDSDAPQPLEISTSRGRFSGEVKVSEQAGKALRSS